MKVAVAATGNTLEAQVDPRFGRARFFLIVDTDSGMYEVCDNTQSLAAPHGAGTQAAATISRCGAQVVIAGDCGPKAFRALTAAGVQVYVGVSGTVAQAIEALKAGRLTPAQASETEEP